MYVLCNNAARCCNHCCSVKTINITYTESEFVALITHYAMHMHHIVFCGLSDCTISTVFFHFLSKTGRFPENTIEHKMCFDFFYNFE